MRFVTLLLLCFAGIAGADEPLEIRAMTFNIRYDNPGDGDHAWPHRREMVIDLINDADMDVIGLQEALRHQLDAIRQGAPQFAEIGVGRDDGRSAGEHSSILYRHDRFAIAASGTFWLSDTPSVVSKHWGHHHYRVCTWAHLRDVATDRALYVFNTHFDHQSQRARANGAALIRQRIRDRATDDPVVLTGDMNAGEDNPAIAELKARSQEWARLKRRSWDESSRELREAAELEMRELEFALAEARRNARAAVKRWDRLAREYVDQFGVPDLTLPSPSTP